VNSFLQPPPKKDPIPEVIDLENESDQQYPEQPQRTNLRNSSLTCPGKPASSQQKNAVTITAPTASSTATKAISAPGKGAIVKSTQGTKLVLSSTPSISTRSKAPQQQQQLRQPNKEADIIHHSKKSPLKYPKSGHLKRKFSNAFVSEELEEPFDDEEEAEFPY
jgi:hypothetical protein